MVRSHHGPPYRRTCGAFAASKPKKPALSRVFAFPLVVRDGRKGISRLKRRPSRIGTRSRRVFSASPERLQNVYFCTLRHGDVELVLVDDRRTVDDDGGGVACAQLPARTATVWPALRRSAPRTTRRSPTLSAPRTSTSSPLLVPGVTTTCSALLSLDTRMT